MKLTLVATAVAFLASISIDKSFGIVLTEAVPTYTQDFDTLANSGTSSTVPSGWAFLEGGASGDTTYSTSTGSSTAGDTYSFGSASSTERAFGSLASSSVTPIYIGASFINGGLTPIISFSIRYFGEQWRNGTADDILNFQFSLDATSLGTGMWTDLDILDFPSIPGVAANTLDGNLAANRREIAGTLVSTVAPGSTLWIRWVDVDSTGTDDGLAVDDFSITATFAPVPEPTSILFAGALAGVAFFDRRRRRRFCRPGAPPGI